MWRQVTEDDVMSGLTALEATALRALLLASGQEEPMPVHIRNVVSSVRDDIRSYTDNRLSPDETLLPQGAIRYAAMMIRFDLITRFASTELMNEDRRTANQTALNWLKEVRRGIAKIERFDEPPEDTAPVASPAICARPRRFGRRQQDGI